MTRLSLFTGATLVALCSIHCSAGAGAQDDGQGGSVDSDGGALRKASGSSSGSGAFSDPATTPDPGSAANADDAATNGDDGSVLDVPGSDGSAGSMTEARFRHHDAGTAPVVDAGATSTGAASSTHPAGWLYTQGNHVYLSNGTSGTPWVGRGVNVDDVLMCGYDGSLWMTSPDQAAESVMSGLIKNWKPTFLRLSLAMDSYSNSYDWPSNTSNYATMMKNVVNSIVANPNVYVLVTVRSHASMTGYDTSDGDQEATGLPSSASTTPDKAKYPTGTDATYVALVDAFANSKQVLFGLSNEPGGSNKDTNAQIVSAMNHAVGVIRAEENRLGVPHHIVSVQGNGWSGDVSFYAATPAPITYDNVVYELHYYPGSSGKTSSVYSYSSTIPMIVGEYGGFTSTAQEASFYADMESKQIPSLAWDLEPYSNCSPDLVNVTGNATLTPTAWGSTVQSYLLAH